MCQHLCDYHISHTHFNDKHAPQLKFCTIILLLLWICIQFLLAYCIYITSTHSVAYTVTSIRIPPCIQLIQTVYLTVIKNTVSVYTICINTSREYNYNSWIQFHQGEVVLFAKTLYCKTPYLHILMYSTFSLAVAYALIKFDLSVHSKSAQQNNSYLWYVYILNVCLLV